MRIDENIDLQLKADSLNSITLSCLRVAMRYDSNGLQVCTYIYLIEAKLMAIY